MALCCEPEPTAELASAETEEAAACCDLDRRLSRGWLRVAIAAVFAGQGMVFSLAVNLTPPDFGTAGYWLVHGLLAFSAVLVAAILGGPLFRATWGMVARRRLSIEGLFTLSMAGAFAGSVFASVRGEGSVYYEVVAVVLLVYTMGKLVGERSRSRLMAATIHLRERFDTATLLHQGRRRRVPVRALRVGQQVLVGPGEAVSVDGEIVEGVGSFEETPLTGEPLPVTRRAGEAVRAGTWLREGRCVVEVTAGVGQRELDRILRGVETGEEGPSRLQEQADAIMQYFLPVVALISLATGLFWWWQTDWTDAVLNSMAVLLISCPCALGLATPVAIWQGLYRLGRVGLFSRSGDLVYALATTQHVFFDKTGTLCESVLVVRDLAWVDAEAECFAPAVLLLEQAHKHPLAAALVEALGTREVDTRDWKLEAVESVPGCGISGYLTSPSGSRHAMNIGEGAWIGEQIGEDAGVLAAVFRETGGRQIYFAVDGKFIGGAVLVESLRAGGENLFAELEAIGIASTILTGDAQPERKLLPKATWHSGLNAEAKADFLEKSSESEDGESPLFIGDGVNDTLAMRRAAASIAMAEGADIARFSAQGYLGGNRIDRLPEAVRIARATRERIHHNLIYAGVYNAIGITLAAGGLLHPVIAALIMVCSSFFVTMRALRQGEQPSPA